MLILVAIFDQNVEDVLGVGGRGGVVWFGLGWSGHLGWRICRWCDRYVHWWSARADIGIRGLRCAKVSFKEASSSRERIRDGIRALTRHTYTEQIQDTRSR